MPYQNKTLTLVGVGFTVQNIQQELETAQETFAYELKDVHLESLGFISDTNINQLNKLIQCTQLHTLSLQDSLRAERDKFRILFVLRALLDRYRNSEETQGCFRALNLSGTYLDVEILSLLQVLVSNCSSITEIQVNTNILQQHSPYQELWQTIQDQLTKNKDAAIKVACLYETVEQDHSNDSSAVLKFLLQLNGFNQERLKLVRSELLFNVQLEKKMLTFVDNSLNQQQKLLAEKQDQTISREESELAEGSLRQLHRGAKESIQTWLKTNDRGWRDHEIVFTQDSSNREEKIEAFVESYATEYLDPYLGGANLFAVPGETRTIQQTLLSHAVPDSKKALEKLDQKAKIINTQCDEEEEKITALEKEFHKLCNENVLPQSFKDLEKEPQKLQEFLGRAQFDDEKKMLLLMKAYSENQLDHIEILMKAGANILLKNIDGDSIFKKIIESKENTPNRQKVIAMLRGNITQLWPNLVANQMQKEDPFLDQMKNIVLDYLDILLQRSNRSKFLRIMRGEEFCFTERKTDTQQLLNMIYDAHQYSSWNSITQSVNAIILLTVEAKKGLLGRSTLHDKIKHLALQLQTQLSNDRTSFSRLGAGVTQQASLENMYNTLQGQSTRMDQMVIEQNKTEGIIKDMDDKLKKETAEKEKLNQKLEEKDKTLEKQDRLIATLLEERKNPLTPDEASPLSTSFSPGPASFFNQPPSDDTNDYPVNSNFDNEAGPSNGQY